MVDAALPLIASAASSLVRSALIKELGERASQAEQQYRAPSTGLDALETKRLECLGRLQKIRNRATLCDCNKDIQQRVLCLAMEQTINAYEATAQRSLDLVMMAADQLDTALDADERDRARRNRLRMIGVVVSLASLTAIGSIVAFADWAKIDGQSMLPLLGIPTCVVFWSAVGSFASILYRFTNSADREIQDPLRWLFSRPLLGIVMGTITYLVLKAGLLTITYQPSTGGAVLKETNEIVWLIAFLAGFSDRFADGLLRSLVGKLGGDTTQELVGVETAIERSRYLDVLSTIVPRRVASTEPANGKQPDGGVPESASSSQAEGPQAEGANARAAAAAAKV